MADPGSPRRLFGQIAVEAGYVTEQQVEEALASDGPGRLGEKLVASGAMSVEDAFSVLDQQGVRVVEDPASGARFTLLDPSSDLAGRRQLGPADGASGLTGGTDEDGQSAPQTDPVGFDDEDPFGGMDADGDGGADDPFGATLVDMPPDEIDDFIANGGSASEASFDDPFGGAGDPFGSPGDFDDEDPFAAAAEASASLADMDSPGSPEEQAWGVGDDIPAGAAAGSDPFGDEDPFAAAGADDPFRAPEAIGGSGDWTAEPPADVFDPFGGAPAESSGSLSGDAFAGTGEDPFATAGSSDPFGTGDDPFGAADSLDDTFGSASEDDPFGGTGDEFGGVSDSFAGDEDDPFGDNDPYAAGRAAGDADGEGWEADNWAGSNADAAPDEDSWEAKTRSVAAPGAGSGVGFDSLADDDMGGPTDDMDSPLAGTVASSGPIAAGSADDGDDELIDEEPEIEGMLGGTVADPVDSGVEELEEELPPWNPNDMFDEEPAGDPEEEAPVANAPRELPDDVVGELAGAVVEDVEIDGLGFGDDEDGDRPAAESQLGGMVVDDIAIDDDMEVVDDLFEAAPSDSGGPASLDSWESRTSPSPPSPTDVYSAEAHTSPFDAADSSPFGGGGFDDDEIDLDDDEDADLLDVADEEATDVDLQVQAKAREEKTDRSLGSAGQRGFGGRGGGYKAARRPFLITAFSLLLGLTILTAGGFLAYIIFVVPDQNPVHEQLMALQPAPDRENTDWPAPIRGEVLELMGEAQATATYQPAINRLRELYLEHGSEPWSYRINSRRGLLEEQQHEAIQEIEERLAELTGPPPTDRDRAIARIHQLEELASTPGDSLSASHRERIASKILEIREALETTDVEPSEFISRVNHLLQLTDNGLPTVARLVPGNPQASMREANALQESMLERRDSDAQKLQEMQVNWDTPENQQNYGALTRRAPEYVEQVAQAIRRLWGTTPNWSAADDSLDEAINSMRRMQELTAANAFPVRLPVDFAPSLKVAIRTPWGDAVVARAEQQLETLRAQAEGELPAPTERLEFIERAEVTETEIGNTLNTIRAQGGEGLTPSNPDRPAEIRAEAARLRIEIRDRVELQTNVNRLRDRGRNPRTTEDWQRIRELAEAVLNGAADRSGELAETARRIATFEKGRAEWHIEIDPAERLWATATADQATMDPAAPTIPSAELSSAVETWTRVATIYSQLYDLLWDDDGNPHDYTALLPWQTAGTMRNAADAFRNRNHVVGRRVRAAIWRDYYKGRLAYAEAAESLEAGGTMNAAAGRFEQARETLAAVQPRVEAQPDLGDVATRIERLIFSAQYEPELIQSLQAADAAIAQLEQASSATQFGAAATKLREARTRLEDLLDVYQEEDPDTLAELVARINELSERIRFAEQARDRSAVGDALVTATGVEDDLLQRARDGDASMEPAGLADAIDAVEAARVTAQQRASEAQDPAERQTARQDEQLLGARIARLEALQTILAARRSESPAAGREMLQPLIAGNSTAGPEIQRLARLANWDLSADLRRESNESAMQEIDGGQATQWSTRDGSASGDGSAAAGTFWADTAEVTNGEYRQFLAFLQKVGYDDTRFAHPSQPRDYDSRHIPTTWRDASESFDAQPVVGVTFWDAYAYATWAGKTLPTAAQWTALAGTADPASANHRDAEGATFGPLPAAEGTADANGVVHAWGNVAEWTMTFTSGTQQAVVAGGHYLSAGDRLAPTAFDAAETSRPDSRIGFRCIMLPASN